MHRSVSIRPALTIARLSRNISDDERSPRNRPRPPTTTLTRMKLLLSLAILATALLAGSAQAATVAGQGTNSCGTWTSWRRAAAAAETRGGIQTDQARWSYQIEQWILGFLSGIAIRGSVDPLKGTDFEGVWAWVDNYCQAHPLDDLATAAVAFVRAHPR